LAVIVWTPWVNEDVLKLALPLLSVTVERIVLPSSKVTVPVGVPEPEVGVTVAVNITD
jgi:hypothetical protein